MTVLKLSKKDIKICKECGLTVTKTNVSGVLTTGTDDKIIEAYAESVEYKGRFVFYVGNHPKLKKKMKENDSMLLEGNIFVVALHTYEVYTEALHYFHDIYKPASILIDSWHKIEVYHRFKEDSKPHLEPRFYYTPTARVYQVEYESRFYRVEVSDNTGDNGYKYRVRVASMPLFYTDSIPPMEYVLSKIKDRHERCN